MRRLKWGLVGLLMMAVGSAAATEISVQPGLQRVDQSSSEQTLQLGVWEEVSALHPFLADQPSSRYILHLVAEPLVDLNAKWQWQCRLCKDLPTPGSINFEIVNDPNLNYGQKLKFTMQPSMRWGDGRPVTAFDFLFTWQVANRVDADFASKAFFRQIEHIDVDPNNSRIFTLYLRKAQYLYDSMAEVFLLPRHLEQAIWNRFKDSEPEQYFQHSLYRVAPTTPGLYNGAFQVAAAPGAAGGLRLSRNTGRRSKRARLASIGVHALKGASAQKRLSMDVLTEVACRELDCRALQGDRAAPPRQLIYGDSTTYEHVSMNLRNPFLRDRNVRKALLLAIDKESLFAELSDYPVVPAVSPFHPALPNFAPDAPYFPYDPEESRRLLTASGWLLDEAGQHRVKNERLLSLTLVTGPSARRERLAKSLIAAWAQVGIVVEHVVQSQRTFSDETLAKMRYDALVLYAWDMPVDASWRGVLHSEAIPSVRNGYVGQNIAGWNSHKVDHWLDSLDIMFDPGKRAKVYHDLQMHFAATLPHLPLYFDLQKALVHPELTGFAIAGHQYPSSSQAVSWHFIRKGQDTATLPRCPPASKFEPGLAAPACRQAL